MTEPTPPSDGSTARQDWLAVLAHAARERLAAQAGLLDGLDFQTLRAAETGLTMVRARVGNQGDRFNLGEATLTRCVLRHTGREGQVSVGVGYVLGRDEARARWVAGFDALLQQPAWRDRLQRELIEPLRADTAARRAAEARRTAASRVRFFTLQPDAPA